MEHLHAQISGNDYRVDADAIAEAILRRLLEGRSLSGRQGDDRR